MCNRCIEWGGYRWHSYSESYYERTDKSVRPKVTRRLHREVWRAAHGDVPRGFEIHHRDDDKLNNALENLELLEKGRHSAEHRKSSPIPRKDWGADPKLLVECTDCRTPLLRQKLIDQPRCVKCAGRRAECARKTSRHCVCCGAAFTSRSGNFCSQRCVNLATHGAQRRTLLECRGRAGICG
jgi:hypothetical protein